MAYLSTDGEAVVQLFVGASDTIFDPHWMRLWLEELKKQKLYETTRQNSDQVDQHQAGVNPFQACLQHTSHCVSQKAPATSGKQ